MRANFRNNNRRCRDPDILTATRPEPWKSPIHPDLAHHARLHFDDTVDPSSETPHTIATGKVALAASLGIAVTRTGGFSDL